MDFSNFDSSKLNSLMGLFSGCSSLKSVDFTNFDTSRVYDMVNMFADCTSLQSLDLSNFKTDNVRYFERMFWDCNSLIYLNIKQFNFTSAIQDYLYKHCEGDNNNVFYGLKKLKYIDIRSVTDSNDFLKNAFNSREGLYVCQGELPQNQIITNESAVYVCCTYNNDKLSCNFPPTTTPILPTTIHTTIPTPIHTTIPTTIHTTIPTPIHTTIPTIIHTTIPTPIHTTIPTPIHTTIPTPIHTTIPTPIHTTIPSPIHTTIPAVETTTPAAQATTSIVENTTTTPAEQTTAPETIKEDEGEEEEIPLVLMGFSSFDVSGEDNTVSFDINFAAVNGGPQPSTVTVPLVVDYESRMRFLGEKEIECKLKETGNKDIATYSCERELESPNRKNIKIIPNFTFPGRKNANVVGSTPLANMFMDNLQNVDDSYDNLQNSKIYVLDHSLYNKYTTNLYNITGTMNEKPKSEFDKKQIKLMYTVGSEKTESSCTIYKITEYNYTLNCQADEDTDGDIQSAISFISDEEMLLVNVDGRSLNNPIENTTNVTDNEDSQNERGNSGNKRYYSKSSGGINAGAIVVIILVLVFVVAIVIGVALYLRNKASKITNRNEAVKESVMEIIK